ncbi:hypothetical protein IB286_09095 [Spongiibacter sp. KMU-158]|uniref:Uncharacterized protein n=1 Tax=Spongiibacter pelagi TaxID=2760804 RepID=A0A927C2X1_9GAMM|nr:hypothetical protein [Spongiibacter pelagi]MBD2859163.1 hypothetical protein [Spongiibacter pelagi]
MPQLDECGVMGFFKAWDGKSLAMVLVTVWVRVLVTVLLMASFLGVSACSERPAGVAETARSSDSTEVPTSEAASATSAESVLSKPDGEQASATEEESVSGEEVGIEPEQESEPSSEQGDLDLSYEPQERQGLSETNEFSESSQRPINMDKAFAEQKESESRLKINSKIHVKDGTDLNSVRQDYRGAVDGGEVSVEYKTR